MKEQKFQKITGLMALLVFGLFAVCTLLVLLSGADVYQRLTQEGQAQYRQRTASQYLTTRVRQAEDVDVGDFAGLDALICGETVNGRGYITRIYCYDGYLRELFTSETGAFHPADGEKLLEAKDLSLRLAEDVLYAQITLPDGSCQELTLYLMGKGAGS